MVIELNMSLLEAKNQASSKEDKSAHLPPNITRNILLPDIVLTLVRSTLPSL
jgi:hypothetical protein